MSDIKTTRFLRRDVVRGTAMAALATLASVKTLAAAPSETNEALAPQPTPLPGNNLNTSDILVETLIDWGATHVFGIVGDGINSIIEALRKRQDRFATSASATRKPPRSWRRASLSTPAALAFVSERQARAQSI
jgi:hypothetical protein